MTGMEFTGKTLGLIGTGNIARRAAEILKNGFGVKVIGYDPYVSREAMAKFGYEKFDTVQKLIAGNTFDCFSNGAVLENAARGGLLNEEDLYTALKAGKLRAAASVSVSVP